MAGSLGTSTFSARVRYPTGSGNSFQQMFESFECETVTMLPFHE